jgi:hypothetical protein
MGGLRGTVRVEILPTLRWSVAADKMACCKHACRAKQINPRTLMCGCKHGNAAGIGAHGSYCRIADGWVEWYCDGPRSYNTEEGEHGFLAAVHEYRDAVSWPNPQTRQAVRDPRGRVGELAP